MPVEIRELVIRAVAAQPAQDSAEPEGTGEPRPGHESAADREAIVQECVRQVLRILQQRKAR